LTTFPSPETDLFESIKAAELRRSQFILAIPTNLNAQEDAIQRKLSSENASARSKLRKIYSLMSDLMGAAEPYVACGKGCSSCCKMNVMITQVEANYIEMETGIKPIQLTSYRIHGKEEFISVPCPFLKDDSCSIYEARPFACRKHVSFGTTSYWCEPTRALEMEFPMLGSTGAEGALMDVTGLNSGKVFADIRDFFPQS
jgi:hypothetical protein